MASYESIQGSAPAQKFGTSVLNNFNKASDKMAEKAINLCEGTFFGRYVKEENRTTLSTVAKIAMVAVAALAAFTIWFHPVLSLTAFTAGVVFGYAARPHFPDLASRVGLEEDASYTRAEPPVAGIKEDVSTEEPSNEGENVNEQEYSPEIKCVDEQLLSNNESLSPND